MRTILATIIIGLSCATASAQLTTNSIAVVLTTDQVNALNTARSIANYERAKTNGPALSLKEYTESVAADALRQKAEQTQWEIQDRLMQRFYSLPVERKLQILQAAEAP